MEAATISELLRPFLGNEELSAAQLSQFTIYLHLLLKWNERMNLTSVRHPDEIVTRHFGESIFAGRQLFPDPHSSATLIDVGSGAGFPGLPISIIRPTVHTTLIEAHGKKATFLREVLRGIGSTNTIVANQRAEAYAGSADVVTFRAVEQFSRILPISQQLVKPGGTLGCLLGTSQVPEAKQVIRDDFQQGSPVNLLGSSDRVLWIARRRK